MAITLSQLNKFYFGPSGVMTIYNWTAASSGDTLAVSVPGPQPYKCEFMDANSDQIVSSPPTFGTWTTTGGVSTATVTANSGGVVTNGKMIILAAGA